jgi:hypothetical protein
MVTLGGIRMGSFEITALALSILAVALIAGLLPKFRSPDITSFHD